MEQEAVERIRLEKTKLAEAFVQKEAAMGREFRKAREQLESRLEKQQGLVKEKYGDLLLGSKV